MNKFVIDASAWIEYFAGSEYGAKLNEVIEDPNTEIYTCAITLAEVISKTAKEKRDVEAAHDMIRSNSRIVSIDEQLSKHSGLLHAQLRQTQKDFGIADAIVLTLARRLEAKVITGDPHFRGFRDAVLIK